MPRDESCLAAGDGSGENINPETMKVALTRRRRELTDRKPRPRADKSSDLQPARAAGGLSADPAGFLQECLEGNIGAQDIVDKRGEHRMENAAIDGPRFGHPQLHAA